MLTPDILRDMHKRIVDAYVLGTTAVPFTQISNWTTVKDKPVQGVFPCCYWYSPLPKPITKDQRGNVFVRYMIDVEFVAQVASDRTIAERDAAYSQMVQVAFDHFVQFYRGYIVPSTATDGNGNAVHIDLVEDPTYGEVYWDHGTSMTVGCRLTYVIQERDPFDCSTLPTKFPSLYA